MLECQHNGASRITGRKPGMEISVSDEILTIDFYLYDSYLDDNRLFASRSVPHSTKFVPCVGDEVRFNGVAYKITYRIWIYDEKLQRVALNMTKVPQDE